MMTKEEAKVHEADDHGDDIKCPECDGSGWSEMENYHCHYCGGKRIVQPCGDEFCDGGTTK